MLLLLATMGSLAQSVGNVLSIPYFEGRVNSTVMVPVYLENSDEVVAIQFDITLPFSMPEGVTPQLSTRSNGHSASLHQTSDRRYEVVVMSMQNKPLRGNQGLLLRLPMEVYDGGSLENSYAIGLENIVLADRNGHNLATETEAEGTFAVSREDLPDLTVSDVSFATTTLVPGGSVAIDYTIENIGTGATRAGWTERFYLESTTGTRVSLGSRAYTGTLDAGATRTAQAVLSLSSQPHMDGDVRAVVEVVPNADTAELVADQGNNSGTSAGTAWLEKRLMLTSGGQTVYEGSRYGYATLTLTRSGDWSRTEAFDISSSVRNLLTCNGYLLPNSVSIPSGQASVQLRIAAVDDDIVRARQADICIAAANGYEDVCTTVQRQDNDQNSLALNTSLNELHEGQELTVTATRGGELTDDLVLYLACTAASRFTGDRSITIPAGSTTGRTTLTALRDGLPQQDLTVTFTATATDYQKATAAIRLLDDDRPALTLTALPDVVTENAGNNALTLVVRRDRGLEQPMKVRLTNGTGRLALTNNVATFPAGAESVTVTVNAVDNSAVDGTVADAVTAALYTDDNTATAPQGDRAYATTTVTVNDDEQPYLTLGSKVSTMGEGSSLDVWVTRYVVSASSTLVVNLSSDDPTVQLPQQVTLGAGYGTVHFTVSVPRNQVEDDDRSFTIRATATDLAPAARTFSISDRTLPDAASQAVSITGEHFYSGMPATFTTTIANVGTASVPKGMKVDFYLTTSSHLGYFIKRIPFYSTTLSEELAIGEERTLSYTADLPELTGNYWLYAKLNADDAVTELSTVNNITQIFAPLFIEAPFSVAELATDKDSYLPGEAAIVTGRMTGQLNGQTVRVELKGTGQHSYTDTNIDASGAFTATVPIDRSASGMLQVKAHALGQTDVARTASIHVYNMVLRFPDDLTKLNENYPKSGTLTLYNASARPITGVALKTSTLPVGCNLTLGDAPSTIAAGATVDIPYTVTPTRSMVTSEPFTLTATCAEGLTSEVALTYLCRSTSGNLVLSASAVNTTLLLNSSREITLKLTNKGLRETGPVELGVPEDVEWFSCLSPQVLPSLQPDESTTLTLQLTHRKGMRSGQTFKTWLLLSPESGTERMLNVSATVTGVEYSTLNVVATDVFTKASGSASHVAGATVTIADAKTRQTVMSGQADAQGQWTTDRLTQGTYVVTLSAPRHQSVSKTLVIGPDERQTMTFLLPYNAVVTDFVVEQDLEDNTYSIKSDIDIDLTAPQAIVVPTLPDAEAFRCGSNEVTIVLTNVGRRPALFPTLLFPTIPGGTFTLLNSYPTVLNPLEAYVLRVAYQGTDEGRHRFIATLRMHYGFQIGAERLSEDDCYQVLTGCDQAGNAQPIVNPSIPDLPEGTGEGEATDDDDSANKAVGTRGGTGKALPTPQSSFDLELSGIDQLFTTRTFSGLLHVRNGQSAPMSHVTFEPSVCDEDWADATDLFTAVETDGTTLVKTGTAYTLPGNSEGTIALQFTPGRQAATDGPKTYLVGGQLGYIDEATGIRHTASLAPIMVTVNPMGEVELTYLIQPFFFGDDAQTEDVVEESQPAQFALLVRNVGGVGISDLQVSAQQPTVVSEADGEPQAYNTLYSELDGQAANIRFSELALPAIEPQQAVAARWINTTLATGHVADVDAIADGVQTAVGSTAEVKVNATRRLVRTIADNQTADTGIGDDELPCDIAYKVSALAEGRVFLLDELEDAANQPDHVLRPDAEETETVAVVTDRTELGGQSGNYTLQVSADAPGWVYGELHDPTNGTMMLQSVVRQSDGRRISPANFWVTDRTLAADGTIIQENLLHFADLIASTTETYTLTFVANPDEPSRAFRIRLFTDDGTEVAADGETTERVVRATVEFTRPMQRWVKNALCASARGQNYQAGLAETTASADLQLFTIDMHAFAPVPGEHSLTVLANKLKGTDKRKGEGSLTVNWTERLQGTAHVDISIMPDAEAGQTRIPTGDVPFGMQTFQATPAEGYVFEKWTADGELLGTEATLTYDVWQDVALKAHFTRRTCQVEVQCPVADDLLKGAASGTYDWGTELTLSVQPEAGYYRFDHWECNGEALSGNTVVTVRVEQDALYQAVFVLRPTVDPITVRYLLHESGVGTLMLPFDAEVPEGLQAFTAVDVQDNTIVLQAQETIVAGRPLIVVGKSLEYTFTGVPTMAETQARGELLVGTTVNATVAEGYVLQTQDGLTGFYRILEGAPMSIPAFHCWLVYDSDANVLAFNDLLDAVRGLVPTPAVDSRCYDLTGRRSTVLRPGTYIVGGKKIVIKH